MIPSGIRSLLTLITLLFSITVFGQSNPMDKKMQKAYSYLREKKYDAADEYLEKLLKEDPHYGEGWDLLVELRYKLYEDAKATDPGMSFKVSMKDKDGNEIKDDALLAKNDSLMDMLMKAMEQIKPSAKAYNKFLYTARKATLYAPDAAKASQYLRILHVDGEVDTNVSKKALKYYEDAEKEFMSKNYNKAAMLYKRALEEQKDFYKASLYMGDCFYFTENYTEAIGSFRNASERFPNLIEPRKYLIDAYAKLDMHEKVLTECINAYCVYPDYNVTRRFEDALYMTHKKLDIKPVQRGVLPNRIKDTTIDNKYAYPEADEEQPQGIWKYYADATGSAERYYNTKGILKTKGEANTPYLEVYSWEQMLKNSNDPELDEARRMQKDGYLDCYVLVSNYHFDIYDQYSDFVKKNKDKVIQYYQKYITFK